MEQSQPATTADRSIPVSRRARLTSSEPSPQTDDRDNLANSIPSLRFPRPLGNRQLHNWVSSSSPDIMHNGNILEEDQSLTELGYDIIGTDGESQAESTTSSFDYARPDDVQSLTGTDTGTDVDTNEVDTDSSDDEDVTTLNEVAAPNTRVIDDESTSYEDDEVDMETIVNQSLEHPTSLPPFGPSSSQPLSYQERARAEVLLAAMQNFSAPSLETPEPRKEEHTNTSSPTGAAVSTWIQPMCDYLLKGYRWASENIMDKRHVMLAVSGLMIVYTVSVVGKSLLFASHTTRELSTVPYASVSSVNVVTSNTGVSSSIPIPISTSTSTNSPTALQTGNSANSLSIPVSKENSLSSALDRVFSPFPQTVCSAELHSRNEILVKIPQAIKSIWLAKDAIFVAVSRGIEDIPTKMFSVGEGFIIQVPLREAHGTLAISIATTRKPTVNEVFEVYFGGYRLTEAFDVGKQLVIGFAQKVVDTVNETTVWVEETYIPALDVMSKQVCHQTSTVSETVLQGLREAGNNALGFSARLSSDITTQVKDGLTKRADQARTELTRQAQDLRDEMAMSLLNAQLNSKLLWLKMQGKTDEYDRYLGKAEVYIKEKRRNAVVARQDRADQVKRHIRAGRQQETHNVKWPFWSKGSNKL